MSKRVRTKYDLEIEPEGYGFGHNWTLVKKTGKKTNRFWLGQDAKVTSRILGMDFGNAVDYYSRRAGSKDFKKVKPYIVRDIVRATGASRRRKAEPWDYAVH